MSYTTTGSDSLWVKSQKIISSGDEIIIDTLKLASFRCLKYILCVHNKAQDKTKMMEISIVKENDSIKEIVHGKIGSSMNLEITTEKTTLDFNLKLKNNEAYSVVAEFAKLILGS